MTEQEAKTKWCPFTQQRISLKQTETKPRRIAPRCRCLASGCMAWRLISPLNPGDGYCGLADGPRYTPRFTDADSE